MGQRLTHEESGEVSDAPLALGREFTVEQDLVQDGEQILFVDDHPRNCVDVKENFPEAWVWLMSRPFNQDFDHPTIQRAKHWEQVLQSLPTAS